MIKNDHHKALGQKLFCSIMYKCYFIPANNYEELRGTVVDLILLVQ